MKDNGDDAVSAGPQSAGSQSPASLSAGTVSDDGGVMVRVSSLDGIRGLAVLFVLLYHASQPVISGFLLQSGVDLFFVLSGFLITTILLKTTDGPSYFRNFYGRRFVRIFPLYYLTLAASLVIAWFAVRNDFAERIGFGAAQNLIDNQIWGWLYQVNNLEALHTEEAFAGLAHLWSLSIEEQFYLLWPLVVLWLGRRRVSVVKVAVAMAAIGMAFRCVTYPILGRDFAYYFTFCRIDGLLLGAAGAAAWRDDLLRERMMPAVQWLGRRWWVIGVLLLMPEQVGLYVGFTVLSVAYLGSDTQRPVRPPGPTPRPAGSNAHFSSIWASIRTRSTCSRYRSVRVANGVYPTNVQIVDAAARTLVVAAISYGMARLSWVLWEQPWLRLKRRFSYA
ncbi:MAG: acyltransferase [Microthrixaceae bacterium]